MSKYLTHKEASDHCNILSQLAARQIKAIASDKRFNANHKQTEIAKIKRETNAKIEEVRADTKSYAAELKAALELKSRYSVTPSEAQIGQLNYVKQALEARWKTMSATEMRADWQAAIETKDTITSRVYRDFSAAIWQVKNNGKVDGQPSGLWQELADQTETLILPPEVLTARQQLAALDAQNRDFLVASRTAMSELEYLVLDDSGTSAVTENPVMTMVKEGF